MSTLKPKNPKKKNRKAKPPVVTEAIQAPYRFNAEEIGHMNQELRVKLDEIDALEDQKKQSMADFKLRISTRENEAKQLRIKLASGEETRPLNALVEFNPKKRMKSYHHPETKAFIREEPMTAADFQLPMFQEKGGQLVPAQPQKSAPAALPDTKGAEKAAPASKKSVSKAEISSVPPKGYLIVSAGNTTVGDKKFVTGSGWETIDEVDLDMPVSSFLGVARQEEDKASGKTNLGEKLDAAKK